MTEHDPNTADASDLADEPGDVAASPGDAAPGPGAVAADASGRGTKPDPTKPNPTEPNPTEPNPTEPETTAAVSEPAAEEGDSKPIAGLMAAYAVGRLGIFVILGAIFWAFGFRGLPGLLAAALISIPLSFVLLKVWRVELARRIEERKTAQLRMKDAFRTTGRD